MPTLSRPSTMAALGLLLAVALGAGCQPTCKQLCVESARYVDGCLEFWDAVWPEMGYDNADQYVGRCQERVETTIALQDITAQRALRLKCADALGQLTTSVSCNDYTPNDFELDPNGDEDNGVLPQPQP